MRAFERICTVAVLLILCMLITERHSSVIQSKWDDIRSFSFSLQAGKRSGVAQSDTDKQGANSTARPVIRSPDTRTQVLYPDPTPASSRKRLNAQRLAPSRGDQIGKGDQIVMDEASGLQMRDGVIVVGRLSNEDTSWILRDLPEWQNAIYTVDDPSAPLSVSKNKGKEANAYLQYIIDNYHNLPETIIFLHSHRDGYPQAWHTEFSQHSNVETVQMLQTDHIQRNGYANLRCNPNPGCPDEIRPFLPSSSSSVLQNSGAKDTDLAFARAWVSFFNSTDVPDVVATPCCAQFAVSRKQVLKRPLSAYTQYHRWLMQTELEDDVSGRVMEYMWHIIFGQDPVYCPDISDCYFDVYGI
ncbi:DUF3431 domain-containing protein [Aspergillus candidus]|uniref:Uncharacterized protein n=1 Tax=Aspergillus candidus TaxID=41067 RepID=A0A2I2F3J3_ASPCN|nr:hypothetical protein BDW47DRAFT_128359 [Aspergillus candidus]PLB35158.1 hypothetical protein BDW47DRAFT_128359 [Aspergillus candidus]